MEYKQDSDNHVPKSQYRTVTEGTLVESVSGGGQLTLRNKGGIKGKSEKVLIIDSQNSM